MDTQKKMPADVESRISVHDQAQASIPGDEDRDTLLHYYYQMVLIRQFEEKAAEMYAKARIGGYCHLNLGEEATVVGFCAGLEPSDRSGRSRWFVYYHLLTGEPSASITAVLAD